MLNRKYWGQDRRKVSAVSLHVGQIIILKKLQPNTKKVTAININVEADEGKSM